MDKKIEPLISVKDAAILLGISQQTIRIRLITGAFPFGAAIPTKHDNHITYRYVIPLKRFEKWVNGDDLVNRVPLTDNVYVYENGDVILKSIWAQETEHRS